MVGTFYSIHESSATLWGALHGAKMGNTLCPQAATI